MWKRQTVRRVLWGSLFWVPSIVFPLVRPRAFGTVVDVVLLNVVTIIGTLVIFYQLVNRPVASVKRVNAAPAFLFGVWMLGPVLTLAGARYCRVDLP